MAIGSLVLGFAWLFGLGSLLGVILGVIALRQIRDGGGVEKGRGLAIAGVLLGIVGLVSVVVFVAFYAWLYSWTSDPYY